MQEPRSMALTLYRTSMLVHILNEKTTTVSELHNDFQLAYDTHVSYDGF